MAYSNGIITPPVRFADVQTAIGLPSTDLATLCKGSNINMWAKFKPVRKSIIDINSQLNSDKSWKLDTDLSDPWWSANNGDYGLTYTPYNVSLGTGTGSIIDALASLANAINGQLNGWGYQKPNGGSSSPYRLTDFNYHNTRAPRPATVQGNSGNVMATVNSDWQYSLQFLQPNPSTPIHARNYLLPTDITGFSLFPGMAIFKKVNNQYVTAAWTEEFVWTGVGIKDASYPDGIIGYGDNYVISQFVNGATYYALPVLFGFSCPQLGTYGVGAGRSKLPTRATVVIPYPYTTFTSFTCTKAATGQRMGLPQISNHNLLGPLNGYYSFATKFILNSAINTSWYNDRASHPVTIALVNELFTGAWNSGTFQAKTDLTVAVPANTVYEFAKYGSGAGSDLPVQKLDASHTWRVYFNVNGYETYISLRSEIQPEV